MDRHNFDSGPAAAEQAALRLAAELSLAVNERGRATLATAAGAAALPALEILAEANIPWPYITICPVEDCCAPLYDLRSREAALRAVLGRARAASARFCGLYVPSRTADLAAFSAAARLARLPRPLDCVVLDMDAEGQTAGLFKDGSRLKQALSPDCRALVVANYSKARGEMHLTMSLPLLASARLIMLPLRGKAVLPALEEAAAAGPAEDMPIRAVLRAAKNPLEVYWSPE